MEPLAYSLDMLAEVAGIGRTRAFEEIRSGRLVATKLGRRTVVLHRDLAEYLEARRAETLAGRGA